MEQEEYTKEQIDWSYIEFVDNQDVLDLIEKVIPIPSFTSTCTITHLYIYTYIVVHTHSLYSVILVYNQRFAYKLSHMMFPFTETWWNSCSP